MKEDKELQKLLEFEDYFYFVREFEYIFRVPLELRLKHFKQFSRFYGNIRNYLEDFFR